MKERSTLILDERLLEARKKDLTEEFRSSVQLCTMGLAVPLFIIFWIADLVYVPHLKWEFLLFRVAFLPIPILAFFLSKKAKTLRGLQALALLFAFPAALFITAMVFIAEGPASPYYAGLNLVLLATLAFLPWSKPGQVLLIVAVWGPYYLWSYLSHPHSQTINQIIIYSFFNVATIVVSLIIRFFYNRLRFKEIQTRLELRDEQDRLKTEQKKLEKANRLIREAFGRYLSDDVVESILESPEGLALGGERRRATIMITDLRGFTSISEQLKPEQVVELLNLYFQRMFAVAQQYQGTINEISGDTLLVLFGAPQHLEDRAPKAVACAIAMQNAMAEVNEANRARGLPELEMGIGINEAEVIVGNVGSSRRSKYGVVGAGVNLTHRIQSYATGGQILVSESVCRNLGDNLRIDDRMEVQPKGSEAPIVLYEVGGIGEPYNLLLEDKEAGLIPLSATIDIRYAILDGKHITAQEMPGEIVNLSAKACELKVQTALEPLTNLKFRLTGVSPKLVSKDFYGKIEKDHRSDPRGCRVRFTALPPAIYGYLQAVLDREMRNTDINHAAQGQARNLVAIK
jgi:class 3 adenylate cyclase